MADINSIDPKGPASVAPGLPSFPPAPGAPGAQPSKVDLAQLWALLGAEQVDTVDATKEASKGNKTGASQRYASMGMPPVPKANMTPQTLAAYDSLKADMHSALGALPATVAAQQQSNQPPLQKARHGMQLTNPAAPNFDAKTFAQNLSRKTDDVLKGLNTGNGNALYAFMLLRIAHGDQIINELQTLSQLSTDMQSTATQQQIEKSKESERSAQKAHKKAGILGTLNKVLTVVLLVVTVVFAAFTFGAAAFLATMAAMLIAGVIAGAVKGKQQGKSFDVWGGMQIAGFVGDGIMFAAGVGAVIMALRQVMAKGATSGLTSATKAAAETAGKNVTRTGTEVIGDVGAHVAGHQAFNALENATRHKLLNALAKGTLDKAAKRVVFEQSMKTTFERVSASSAGHQALGKLTTKKLGAGLGYLPGAVLVAQGAAQIPPAIIKLQASLYQNDSDRAQADLKIWKAVYELFDDSYKNLQDTIQHIVDGHSKAVDAAQSMLKNKQTTNLAMARNMG